MAGGRRTGRIAAKQEENFKKKFAGIGDCAEDAAAEGKVQLDFAAALAAFPSSIR